MDWYLKCIKQYVDFDGRARRKEYWTFTLFNIIFQILLYILAYLFLELNVYSLFSLFAVLSWIYPIAVLLPSLAVCIRRLHDIGKSGWWYLLNFIPFVGVIILIIWFCKDGMKENNQWGENPKVHILFD